MRSASTGHTRFRELISARLDGRLPIKEQRELNDHLRKCSGCAAVERGYREQRAALRALPASPPPRDLWARTRSALDRDMARDRAFRGRRRRPGPLVGGWALVSVVAVAVGAALAMAQLRPAGPLTTPGPELALATPFGIPSQPLAFLASTDDGLALYRTHVDRVCPPAVPDCVDDDVMVPSVIALPRDLRPSELALSPTGKQLAIVGRNLGSDDVISVVLMPAAVPTGPDRPSSTPVPEPSPSVAPPVESTTPTAIASSGPEVSPPAAGSLPPASGSLPPETAAPPTAAVPTAAPPTAALPAGLTVLAILQDVRSAGAPPAWSADGSILCFSAMPADESHGPDVYIWRPGDDQAMPITTDHHSYFASWSGSRVVVSRVTPSTAAEPLARNEPAGVTTVVIHPLTLEERTAEAADLWLPVVGPLGRQAITWFGRLEWNGRLVQPVEGALYLTDWAQIDPFAGDPEVTETGEPNPGGSVGPGSGTPPAGPARPPSQPTPATDQNGPPDARTPDPQAPSAAPRVSPPAESAAPAASPDSDPLVVPSGLAALEPARDPRSQPVVDWQVHWSSDGSVLGYWVADAPGASWGELVVLLLDPSTGALGHDTPLLAPTLARRGFSLGLNRVAWVAAGAENPEGELRIRTWGSDGVGGIRLRPFDLREVVPAF